LGLATPSAALRDDIPGRKGAPEGYRQRIATIPFRHVPKGGKSIKLRLKPGRLPTVSKGFLRPLCLDFLQIMAKINPLN
jgi:hypothetical protein